VEGGKFLLWIGLAVCFAYGFFWRGLYENGFFILQAVSFFLLSLYIHLKDKCLISFLWLAYCINNLVDELLGDPTTIGSNEKLIIVLTPLIWLIKKIWTRYPTK